MADAKWHGTCRAFPRAGFHRDTGPSQLFCSDCGERLRPPFTVEVVEWHTHTNAGFHPGCPGCAVLAPPTEGGGE